MKRILVSVIFTLLLLPCAYSQENITDCDELAIITSALKGSRGVEYIRRDHRPVNGKTFRGTNPINITTYLFKRNDRGKNEYEHLAADSKYMDRDMYNDFLEKNKESVIVDTTRFDDCILDFTTLEQARQFLDPALDDEAQSKKLLELIGDKNISVASRPGFNKDKSRAIIYNSIMSATPRELGGYSRNGSFQIYEKQGDKWKLVDML